MFSLLSPYLRRLRNIGGVTLQAQLHSRGETLVSIQGLTTKGSHFQNGTRAMSPVSHVRRGVSATPELTHQQVKGRRRFYKEVTTREISGDEGGAQESSKRWEIFLDGRVLKTPARQPLQAFRSQYQADAVDFPQHSIRQIATTNSSKKGSAFDSAELALAVAAEWDAQNATKGLEPALMPLMSLASTAIDQVAQDRERVIATCLNYLPTDTVCFLAPEPDAVITRRERQLWAPLRDWTAKELGIPVGMTTGVHDRPKHPPEAMVNARALLEACDDWALAALQSVAMECKSLIIALAVAFRKTTVEKAFDAARLEEEYNVERWGMVEGGHDMDRANTTLTLTAASTLLWLRRSSLPKATVP